MLRGEKMIENNLLLNLGFNSDDTEKIEYADSICGEKIETIARDYWEKRGSFPHFLKRVRKTCDDISPYTLDLLFILHLTSFLKIEYEKRGIPEEIYWDTVKDIKFKTDECKMVKNAVGTFVAEWFEGFFRLTRFSFGRLQFDVLKSDEKISTKIKTVKKGDFILSCHIPSGSKLSYNDCTESYKRAYDFFKDRFVNSLPIICISWLLYPEYEDAFENCPNTKRFIGDFTIYKVKTQKSFEDAWRVFGCDEYKNTQALPDRTTMQRAFIKHIEENKKFGYAFGILFFDGKRVIK